jgi:hypothetical protein
MTFAAINNAEVAAWISLIVGIIVMGTGLSIGVFTSLTKAPTAAKEKVDEAKGKLDDTKTKLGQAKAQIQSLGTTALESAGIPDTDPASAATDEAADAADAAQSAIQQMEGIIGTLPEHLRFAGMLVLVGAALMGVATVQFGGTSLF